jgi:VanZ family protein
MRFSRPLKLAVAALYFLICNVLFFLPGNAFPKEDWLDKIYFDKWVHTGIFGLLALLCHWSLQIREKKERRNLAFALIGYGLMVELIQGAFVPRRSCDPFDLLADSTGALIGIWIAARFSERRSLR